MLNPKGFSNSVLRTASIIKSFTQYKLELTPRELASENGLPQSTVYYILASLTKSELLEKTADGRKYTIGHALFEKGALYLKRMDVVKIAEPVVKILNDLINEGISVGVLYGTNVTRVLREESKRDVRFIGPIGESLPAYASNMGKALISDLSDDQIDNLYPSERLIPRTPRTIRTKTELKLELKKIRETGVAFDKEGCYEGVESIASVIRGSHGKAVAAISISLPVSRMNAGKRRQFAELIKMGATLINYKLGYKDKSSPVQNIQDIRSWWEQKKVD